MKLTTLTLCAALCVLCACSDSNEPQTPGTSEHSVTLSATKSAGAFAASSAFKQGSQIGVYLTAASTALQPSSNLADNQLFTATATGFTTTGLIYPSGVPSLDFYAYAPHSTTGIDASKMVSFSVQATQTTSDSSDLLWANKKGVASGSTPALVFDHKLAQIVITLKAAPGIELTSPVVTLANTLSTVKMNVETGALEEAEGSAQTISPTSISATELHAIIVPQSLAKGTDFILVQNGGKTFKYVLDKAYIFASGMSNTFEITVKENDIDVTFTGSINDWTPGDTTPGDAV